jgi:putative membrane-bound dehydrogenase-like protein
MAFAPQTRQFEVFAHGTSNPWGVDWNDNGQCFITACVIPHLYHIVQGGLYQRQSGKHYNEAAYNDIKTIARHRHWGSGNYMDASRKGADDTDQAGGGHAHCGALVYLGESWPAEYRGTILMNNIHGNRMNNDSLLQVESGFVGDRRPDFMKSQDKWYRGLGIKQGPDGSVYVADWYDARACHQQKPHDRTNGRIYKIVYKDTKQSPVDVAKMSDADLVKAQTSKNEWLVRHARRVLQERGQSRKCTRRSWRCFTISRSMSLSGSARSGRCT